MPHDHAFFLSDSFVRVGNYFTGGYFVGPEGRSFCQRGSEMHFMVSGQCTSEAISCLVRAPQRAGDTRSAPRKHEELQFSSRPTFLQKQQALRKSMAGKASPPPAKLTNLVLMLKFNDTKTSDINPVEDFDELFNSEKGPSNVIATESVRTYYTKSSHGRLTINNVLTGWIDLPFSEAYVAGACVPLTEPDSRDKDGLDCPNGLNVREAIMEGLRRYELKVNNSAFFKQFDADGDGLIDMFTVVHSGNGAENTGGEGVLGETIWSHKVSACRPVGPPGCFLATNRPAQLTKRLAECDLNARLAHALRHRR